jgi:hypothetical protein
VQWSAERMEEACRGVVLHDVPGLSQRIANALPSSCSLRRNERGSQRGRECAISGVLRHSEEEESRCSNEER